MHVLTGDRPHGADEGMSIVEVLIASVILLIALTSMLGLLLTSTNLSAQARAESLAVTTANKFIETVRQTTYRTLSQARLDQLATAASGTVGGMTVSVAASMTPQAIGAEPSAYQEVKVLVSVAGPGFKRFEFRTGTFVREWRYSGTDTRQKPFVEFDDETPAAGATARPIWGTVHVGAEASSTMPNVVLTQINVVWRVSGQPASYLATATPGTDRGTVSTEWNTTTVPEGRRGTMYVETWDALNQPDSKTRDFIIDNVLPPAPSGITLFSVEANNKVTWAWPGVMDGETAVPSYQPTVYQLLPQASSSYNEWVAIAQPAVSTSQCVFASAPFSFYYPTVASRGPRDVAGLGTWRSSATSGPTVFTRPGFSAMTVMVEQQNTNKTFYFTPGPLVLTPPTFRVLSQSYQWEYKISSGAWTAFPSAASPNTNPSSATTVTFGKVTGPSSGAQTSLSLRCTATVVRPNNQTYSTKSPIMTITNPDGGKTYRVSDGTIVADWTTSW